VLVATKGLEDMGLLGDWEAGDYVRSADLCSKLQEPFLRDVVRLLVI
jgi:hypothetical protein